jgi:hypothetical protein
MQEAENKPNLASKKIIGEEHQASLFCQESPQSTATHV